MRGRCRETKGSQGARGREQRALSLCLGRFCAPACGGFAVGKARGGILQEGKLSRDLSGQGDRKAGVLSVCFRRERSSFLRHLSLHWRKPEPGMRASSAPAHPAGSAWRHHVQKTWCPDSAPSSLAFSRSSDFPRALFECPTRVLLTVGTHLQPLRSLARLQPLASTSALRVTVPGIDLGTGESQTGELQATSYPRPAQGPHQSQRQSPRVLLRLARAASLFVPWELCTCCSRSWNSLLLIPTTNR